MTNPSVVAISSGPRRLGANLLVLLFSLVGAAMLVEWWFDPPREAIWGNSTLLPRIVALVGFPSMLYVAVFVLYQILRSNPLVVLDANGLMVKTHPPRTRRAAWNSIGSVRKIDQRLIAVITDDGRTIKISVDMLADGWTVEDLTERIQEYRERYGSS